ncbi:MAG: helix-turn-helix transcriptional regulator [Bacteriovoracaceae bacterium]|nr:helix-turn-helix transcriptional regulator [Bacteriovoracaceae bacterium]
MKRLIMNSIKSAREKSGMTQKEVESTLELRTLMIKDYETGRLKLPIDMAIRLADLYQVTIDELVNCKGQEKNLVKLEVLFDKNELDMVLLDPIIRGHIETYSDKIFNSSIHDILVTDLNQTEQAEYKEIMLCYLYSLIGVDGKILSTELNFVNFIITIMGDSKRVRALKKHIHSPYSMVDLSDILKKNLHLRHFIIWIMFFLAKSDRELCLEESEYIEKVAEELRVLKSSFIFIKNMFIKGDV